MGLPKKYKNKITSLKVKGGPDRKYELINNAIDNRTLNLLPVVYEDIDREFKSWVENELDISFEGNKLPTMTLFTNQRFSEYSQSWEYTDVNKNLLLNFKTVNRENNPKFGKSQGGYYNIPGDRFYTVKQVEKLNDNGKVSYINYKMKQPYSVNMVYTVNIITNKYPLINEFNNLINNKFKSIQAYIAPNGHYMPLQINNISDESQYTIDDREFFQQSFTIELYAYIINPEDIIIEEVPSLGMICFENSESKPIVEIEELDDIKHDINLNIKYKPIILTIDFIGINDISKFTIDTDFRITDIVKTNICSYEIYLNDTLNNDIQEFKNNDNIKLKIKKINHNIPSKLTIFGFQPNNS